MKNTPFLYGIYYRKGRGLIFLLPAIPISKSKANLLTTKQNRMKKKEKKTKYDYLRSSRYIVYDLSINDLQTRIERAKVYPTAESTAYFLVCTIGKLLNNSEPGKRIKGVDKKLYAVRTTTQMIPANLTNINNNSFKHKRVNNPNFIKS